MQGLEAAGFRLSVAALQFAGSVYSGWWSDGIGADCIFPPAGALLDACEADAGQGVKAALSALADTHRRRCPGEMDTVSVQRTALWLAREFSRRGVQHVHVYAPEAVPVAHYLKAAGFPFSISAGWAFRVEYGSLMHEACAAAEFVLVRGRALHKAAAVEAPSLADRLECVAPGIDASRYDAALCGDAGTLRLLTSGPLTDSRGIPLLLEAMRDLCSRGVETVLTVAGDGPWRADLETKAAALWLNGAVHFVEPGSMWDARRVMAAADLYVHPDTESKNVLPGGILEAMATGLPVLTVDTPGAAELVADGFTGWIVPADKAGALAEKLVVAAEFPEQRSLFGQRGLERVQAAFSLSAAVNRTAEKLYSSLSGRFHAARVEEPPGVLCLMERWPVTDAFLRRELGILSTRPEVAVLSAGAGSLAGGGHLPAVLEFMPDAVILELVWQREPRLAGAAAALRMACRCADGEEFFRAARRAVFTAVLCRSRKWRHVHALRADTALWAWLAHRLTGLSVSVHVERGHRENPGALRELLPDFRFGSVSDPLLGGALPDLFPSAGKPAEKRFSFRKTPPVPEPPEEKVIAAIWRQWLESARSHPEPAPVILPTP
jgi:glycosyltransferase involved in cell wall biosynthesis